MANITINIGLAWCEGTESLAGAISQTYDQTGNAAIEQIQAINSTTEAVILGEISGAKYLMFKNMAPKGTAANPQPTIWVDTVTPVVPDAVTATKLIGGSGSFRVTTQDTWYAIAVAAEGTPGPTTVALPVDLAVVAVEE